MPLHMRMSVALSSSNVVILIEADVSETTPLKPHTTAKHLQNVGGKAMCCFSGFQH